MSHIKALSLGSVAILLSLSTPAFAADCCSSSVLVPSQHGGFKVGFDALYLRPTSDALDYATSVDFQFDPESRSSITDNHNQMIDPSYDWGFYVQVGYLFPCTANDLTIGYTYLNTDEKASVSVPDVFLRPSSFIIVPPLSGIDPNSPVNPVFASAEGKFEATLNVLDLEAGQRFTTGAYDMRMFAGLRYANIDTTLKTIARGFTPPPPIEEGTTGIAGSQNFNSQFRGIGPRIGVDARYCLSSGFGLDADLSTSLLVGTVDSHYNAVETITSTTPPPQPITTVTNNPFTARNGSNARVVPVLEAKLGADYTYIMDCRCKSALVLEAGYQVTNYFNASDHHMRVLSPSGTGFLSPGDTNSIAFDGPYLGVKYYA